MSTDPTQSRSNHAPTSASPEVVEALDGLRLPVQVEQCIAERLGVLLAWHGRALLQLSEFAKVVGLDSDTVGRWVKRELIPTKTINGRTYIPTQQFLRWLDETTDYPKETDAKASVSYVIMPRRARTGAGANTNTTTTEQRGQRR